jgi:predicted nucleic acid-binding protein
MSEPSAKQLVFIDASVWVAAAGSPEGGSSLTLEVCRGARFAAVCSQRVLMEAQTNIRYKMPVEALARFYRLLAEQNPAITPAPSEEEETACEKVVAAKDAHVIAAAHASGAAFLISLDRKHIVTQQTRTSVEPMLVLTPAEFIQRVRLIDDQLG